MVETILNLLARHAVALLMLSIGLRTPSAIVRDLASRRAVLARALLVVWLAVPLLALAAIYLIRPPPMSAAALMVMAICPGVPLVVGRARRARGDPKTSLLVLVATAITALVMVPLWLAVLSRMSPLDIPYGLSDAAAVLLPSVLAPFVVGRIIVVLWPRGAAQLAKVAQALFVLGFGILVVTVLARMMPALRTLGLRDFLAAFLIPFGAAAIGYVAGAHERDDRISLAYAAALGNPALAVSVAAHSSAGHEAVPVMLAFLLVRGLALFPFTLWFKQKELSSAPRYAAT